MTITSKCWIILLFILLFINIQAVSADGLSDNPVLNPASVYCKNLGYEENTLKDSNGEYGVCQLPNGQIVKEWQFFLGDSGQDYNYCSLKGYKTETSKDSALTYRYLTSHVAVCVLPDNSRIEVGRLMKMRFDLFSWSKDNANRPIFQPIDDKYAEGGKLLEFDLIATDPQNDNLIFSLANLPKGATLNGNHFTWNPVGDQVGTHFLPFCVSDGIHETFATAKIIITKISNNPPVLSNPGDQVITEGKTLTLNLQATDPDNDPVTYSFKSDNPLMAATLVGNTFTWTLPSGSAGKYSVTFNATDSGGLSDEETIKITVDKSVITTASITVVSPNDGEAWKRGTVYPITWKYTGSPGSSVSIVLFKGDSQVYTIASSTPVGTGGSGSSTWKIPSDKPLGSDYKVKIQSTSQPTIKDTSNNYFKIVAETTPADSITVVSPDDGETWKRGNAYPITWKYTGSPGSSVSIVLFKGDSQVYTIASSTPVGTGGSGSFDWKIPSDKPLGSDYKVRVQSISQPAIKDTSNNHFIISPATTTPSSITVTSPNVKETWQRGTKHTVTWSYTGNPGSKVKITLLKSGVEVGTISSSTSIGSGGKGSYSWPINPTGSTGSDYKVKVQSISQPTIKDTSNNHFTITPATTTPSSITVTSPNVKETWQRGTKHTVTWSYTGNPGSKVKITLLKSGVEVGTISSSTSIGSGGKGSYSWPISATGGTGSDYKVSVKSISQPSIKDTSNAYFTLTSTTVKPSITVTSPNGGETLKRGGSKTIAWNYAGSPGSKVKIVLLKGTTQVGTIASNVPIGSGGKGTYIWKISTAGSVGNNFKVNVQSMSHPTIKDSSNTIFTIKL